MEQKNLSYAELSELESAFDAFAEQEKACLSELERSESLNDFVETYRDSDQFQSVEEFKDAVLNAGAWTFKCDTKEPERDPYKTAEDMEKTGVTGTAFSGYKMKTTFWTDFTIADKFGASAVQDTFDRAFPEWRKNVVYLTELVLVLNWKLNVHYGENDELATLYDKLWKEADEFACSNLKGKERLYFYDVTD